MVNSFVAEVRGLGGVTQNRMASPKGLYSRPKNEDALVFPLANGNNQDVVIPFQKPVELKSGDVCITDDKSTITLNYEDGGITITTKNIKFKCDTFSVDSNKVEFTASDVSSDGKPIGATHVHIQSAGGRATPTQTPS